MRLTPTVLAIQPDESASRRLGGAMDRAEARQTRRGFLRLAGTGVLAAAVVPLLAACSGGGTSTGTSGTGTTGSSGAAGTGAGTTGSAGTGSTGGTGAGT